MALNTQSVSTSVLIAKLHAMSRNKIPLEALPACVCRSADCHSEERARGTWQHTTALNTLVLSFVCRSVERLPQVMQMACIAAMLPSVSGSKDCR